MRGFLWAAFLSMRLDRFLESRLVSSARSVRLMLAAAVVCVDGVVERDGRRPVGKFSRIEADGKLLQSRAPVYLMLHKPRGCVSATRDGKHRSVLDLVDHPQRGELHLAGRLDFNTTGLLLLSNDGEWTGAITLPGRGIAKTYRVETRDEITPELMPPQDSAPVRRPNSIFGQRFITTRSPAVSARAAASSLRTPSCIQTVRAPQVIASSTMAAAASELRKMSTMSTGSGMSARAA